ncbi:helix-turn-helix domain-containing protein [Ilumatobacter sp.]|uniref:helix-turn-helix domain-containing protein n=1 Tax=Ilumatobacter sp. TaxID=1967498 RepID=UPI003B522245
MKLEAKNSAPPTAEGGPSPEPLALLGIPEVAERLGTPERFVRRLVAERRVPFHKVGKYVRFDQRDIDRYLAAQRVEALI